MHLFVYNCSDDEYYYETDSILLSFINYDVRKWLVVEQVHNTASLDEQCQQNATMAATMFECDLSLFYIHSVSSSFKLGDLNSLLFFHFFSVNLMEKTIIATLKQYL